MKRPVCRLCRTPHYSHEPHRFADESGPQSETREADFQERKPPEKQSEASPRPKDVSAGTKQASDGGPSSEVVSGLASEEPASSSEKGPLSRAEISRRQREKDPEGYRAKNRERMRKARLK